jgi:hypothetical protein
MVRELQRRKDGDRHCQRGGGLETIRKQLISGWSFQRSAISNQPKNLVLKIDREA